LKGNEKDITGDISTRLSNRQSGQWSELVKVNSWSYAVFLSGPASILKACAKGGPARPGSEAARPAAQPARDLKSLHRPA